MLFWIMAIIASPFLFLGTVVLLLSVFGTVRHEEQRMSYGESLAIRLFLFCVGGFTLLIGMLILRFA